MAMGSATNGPLLACNPFGEVVLMDITATAATPVEGSKGNIGGDLTVSGGDITFDGGDEVELKGLSQPWRVHRVAWSPAPA